METMLKVGAVAVIAALCAVMVKGTARQLALALSLARTGDTVVLAGKGHETYQEINGVEHHLDEREEVAAFFAKAGSKFVAF